MAINLINVLQKSFSEKSYQDISQHVGISSESTKNGLKAIIPATLASILGNNTVNNSVQPTWWKALDNDYPYTENEFVLTQNINNSSFLVKGREVISGMFRTNHDELVSSVSSIAGIQKEKAAGLIEVGVPLIVGHLKNWMQKKEWKFKDLIDNLFEHKTIITEALPAGISTAQFGVSNLPKNNFSETIETKIPATEIPKKKKNNGLIWFVGLVVVIIVAILLWYVMNNSDSSKKIKIDTEEMLVPGVRDTVADMQLYEKTIDEN